MLWKAKKMHFLAIFRGEIKMTWKKVSDKNNQKNLLKKIKAVLIGLMILVAVLSCCNCAKTVSHVPLRPINCINNIKTPLDQHNCLIEYDTEYGSLMRVYNERD